jgi:arsenate reductase
MKQKVLVLCTGNTARTQMAEGLFRDLGADRADVVSAGLEATFVHPMAIQVMAERGIDISAHRSKSYTEFADTKFDYVITVCDKAAGACPMFPGPARRLHWDLPDPVLAAGSETERLNVFRQVRNAIELHIKGWLSERPLDDAGQP